MEIGDLVVTNSEQDPLRSGCSLYSHAVVIQVEPLVIVSKESDMRWGSFTADRLAVIGKASDEDLAKCMKRL